MTVTAIQTPHSTQTLAVLLEKDDISHALRHAVIGDFKRLRLPFDPRSPDIWITGPTHSENDSRDEPGSESGNQKKTPRSAAFFMVRPAWAISTG